MLDRVTGSEGYVSTALMNIIRQEAGKCLLLCQEDGLGQASPTAGRASGEIAEGGGSRMEIMCGFDSAAIEIVSKYPQRKVLLLRGKDDVHNDSVQNKMTNTNSLHI